MSGTAFWMCHQPYQSYGICIDIFKYWIRNGLIFLNKTLHKVVCLTIWTFQQGQEIHLTLKNKLEWTYSLTNFTSLFYLFCCVTVLFSNFCDKIILSFRHCFSVSTQSFNCVFSSVLWLGNDFIAVCFIRLSKQAAWGRFSVLPLLGNEL